MAAAASWVLPGGNPCSGFFAASATSRRFLKSVTAWYPIGHWGVWGDSVIVAAAQATDCD